MKSYTSLEQAKKLVEILPLESADMWWLYITAQGKYIAMMHDEPDHHYLVRMESYGIKDAAIRCWSLAALLDILPDKTCVYKKTYKDGRVKYQGIAEGIKELILKDNPVDACYEMILKLKEKGYYETRNS